MRRHLSHDQEPTASTNTRNQGIFDASAPRPDKEEVPGSSPGSPTDDSAEKPADVIAAPGSSCGCPATPHGSRVTNRRPSMYWLWASMMTMLMRRSLLPAGA